MGFFTPAGLSSIGSFASGLGSIASSFGFGGSSNKAERLASSYDTEIQYAKKRASELPVHIVAGAKKAGLHPLSLLGSSAMQSPSFSANYDKQGPDLAAMGQGIDRALNAGRSGMQRKLDELAIEKAGLENDYLRTQIAGSQAAIARTAATPYLDDSSEKGSGYRIAGTGSLADVLKSTTINKMGIDDGLAPRHKMIVDRDGQTFPVLNTEVTGDNEVLMLHDYVARTIPEMFNNQLRRSGRDIKRYWKNSKKWFKKKPRGYKKYVR